MFDISKLLASSIEASLAEWDEIGRQEFLDRHSLHGAFKYVIVSDSKQYDAKAILVRAARRQVSDDSLALSEFGTTEATVAEPLRKLGFTVRPKEQLVETSGDMFTELVLKLRETWDAYRSGDRTSKVHPVHKLVVNDIPSVIESWTPGSENYKIVGSDGQGNILRTPWFAILNRDVTESATRGYYLVYLVSANLEKLVLALGFGATQFERQYGRTKKMFAALDMAVNNMRTNSQHLVKKSLDETLSRNNAQPVELDNSKDFHLTSYEHCTIYSLVYEISNLPSESEMKNDYLEFLNLYNNMCDSLLLADVDSYVFELVDENELQTEVKLEDFEPLVFKKRKGKESSSRNSQSYRYTKKSDKVGKIGEEIVFEFEKKKLVEGGRDDLAQKVNLHRNDASNRTPGWDVSSFELTGEEIFIEVKSSEGQKISEVELTVNEWFQAKENSENNKYKIYLVSDVFSYPRIKVINNPAKLVSQELLELNIARYQLLLGKREK
jgi:hypothetical protein